MAGPCLGFVFQQFHLIPYLSVIDNVLAPALACPIANARGRAEELLEQFGLSARASHVPSELSTGEQQRTALARALVAQAADSFCATSPRGTLTSRARRTVSKCLAEFQRQGGAVLLVTHDSGRCGDGPAPPEVAIRPTGTGSRPVGRAIIGPSQPNRSSHPQIIHRSVRRQIMRQGSIAKPWLIVLVSLVLIAGLVASLWRMSRPPQAAGKELVLCAPRDL